MTTARPPHILFVHADSDVFGRFASAFAEQGYRLTYARDVAAAKDALRQAVIDLVLVDVRLLNGVGMMLVGQAAFGVPLLPLPADHLPLEAVIRARARRTHSKVPSSDPVAIDRLVRWIGDALRHPNLESLP
jgi:DNA-binding NtrC family response regulator